MPSLRPPPKRYLDAKSFQELVASVEAYAPKSVTETPIKQFIEALDRGSRVRGVVERLHKAGVLVTFGDALRTPLLRSDARWEGGARVEAATLRALADFATTLHEASAAPPPSPAPAAPPPAGLHPAMPHKALRTWATERGVEAWLGLKDAALARWVRPTEVVHLRMLGFNRALESAITSETATSRAPARWGGPVHREVQDALIGVLERAAEDIAVGLAEDANRAPADPPDPSSLSLWRWVEAARAELRSQIRTPAPAADRASARFRVEQDPPVVFVAGMGHALCLDDDSEEIQVALQRRSAGPVVSCSCHGVEKRPCPKKLAAVDAVLDALSDPGRADLCRGLVAAHHLPAWARLMDRLDVELVERPLRDKDGVPVELGWRMRGRSFDDVLEPVAVRPKKTGTGLKIAKIDLKELLRWTGLDSRPVDAAVVSWLTMRVDRRRGGDSLPQPFRLKRALIELIGHPRFFLENGAEPAAVRRCTLALKWSAAADGGVALLPMIDGDPWPTEQITTMLQRTPLGELAIVERDDPPAMLLVDIPQQARNVLELILERGTHLPAEAVPALMQRLPAISAAMPCELDEPLRGLTVEADRRPLIQLELLPKEVLRVEARVRPLTSGPSFPPGEGPDQVFAMRPEGRVCALRDRAGEAEIVRVALHPLALAADEGFVWTLDEADRALDVLEALQDMGEAVQVEWRGPSRRVRASVDLKKLSVKVAKQRDWFSVTGGLDIDGVNLPLDALLAAVQTGARFVPVSDGTWVRLSEAFREALRPVAAATRKQRGGALEISGMAAPVMDALTDLGAAVDGAPSWMDLISRLRASGRLEPALPEGLNATLRDYQQQGFVWLARLAAWSPGAVLADDMGLGKTLQALALMLRRASLGPALVVTPTSVSFNWIREAGHFAPSLTMRLYRGADRGLALRDLGPGVVLVTSYDLLARDAEALSDLRFATLVLDEAQAFKNPTTARARAVSGLTADFRLALTGTPIENRLGELWSLFRAVAPGLLGSWEHFRERFATPIERGSDPERRASLARLIRPFILRRLKLEVAKELPSRTEIQVDVELSREERAVYERLRRQALEELASSNAANPNQQRLQVLAALTRLRQAACHPALVAPELGLSSSKLTALRERVAELRAEGHRALIFSQFVRLLELARTALQADGWSCRWLDGSTPERQRRAEVDAFQRGEGDLFLLSLKAGGTGLNLTAATYVIHLDPWWNPAVEDQATDRAHRIGQDQPVTIYRLVARGTLEESILAMHADKRALAADILEGTAGSAALATEDLLALLAEGVAASEGEEAEEGSE